MNEIEMRNIRNKIKKYEFVIYRLSQQLVFLSIL